MCGQLTPPGIRYGAPGVLFLQHISIMPRSILFIDGNNWYHSLKSIGVYSPSLDYVRIARKLLVNRELRSIRFYIGKVRGDLRRVRNQAQFLERIKSQGVEVILGRIERHFARAKANPVALKLRQRINAQHDDLPASLLEDLLELCRLDVPYYVEKQVDVKLAVDLVSGAMSDEYDVAYLLSADGDFVPAVDKARLAGKTVFAASPSYGRQLGRAVDAFIRLDRDWFDGLYHEVNDSQRRAC